MINPSSHALSPSLLAGLRCFQLAAHHLSFTRAGRELHLTQGAVSHRIKALEQELGFALFLRFNRRLQLTAEGEQLLDVVGQSLLRLDTCVRDLRQPGVSAQLNLSAPPSFALSWLAPRLPRLAARQPGLRLALETHSRLVDFHHEAVDLAIYYGSGPFPGLHQQSLSPERLIPVCSPAYAERHRLTGDLAQLDRCTLLHDSAAWPEAGPLAEWTFWCEAQRAASPTSLAGCRFDLMEAAVAAAEAGLGVAMGRALLVAERLAAGRLVAPFGRPLESPQGYIAVCHPDRAQHPAIRALLAWLREEIKDQEQTAGETAAG